ncbi:uncharacterized protein LOC123523487 [Mercenaria mercenaria]|uniref:uncharacterized protein LOC123523487 n=1 Tax=Mercenaria mercenaria TaxID=6596 RepID=UPI00234EA48D|nr:uncharacterized protein LOC123523487 [Mercenaria mercenaria]
MTLQQTWNEYCKAFGVKQDIIDKYWSEIESKYTEKQRYYHTLNHLTHMFTLFDDVKDELSRPELVAMAIFFHDIEYEPTEKDNEEKSAVLFKEFSTNFEAQDAEPQKDSALVFDWIIETKKHETEVHRTPEIFGRDDLHFFLDMDMAILGVSDSDYKKYADEIRQEYIHIPDQLFKQGRAKVLRSFLKVPNIYATEIFRNKFEKQARENIEAEIRRLEE